LILLIEKFGLNKNKFFYLNSIMRILILNQHYFTDNHGYLIGGIAKFFLKKNYKLDLFCYFNPSQEIIPKDNILSKTNIIRVKIPYLNSYNKLLRFIGMLKFSFECLIKNSFNFNRFDVVICSSSHIPLLGLVALIISKINRCKFIYRIEDVWPESETNINSVFNKKLLFIYGIIDKYVCYRANHIVVLSKDMKDTINSRFSRKRKNIMIIQNLPKIINHNSSLITKYLNIPLKKKGTFRLIFIGNVGIKQGLETLIDTMHLLASNKGIELIILGDGAELNNIKNRAANLINNSIIFLPFTNNDLYVSKLIYSSDLGIVSLNNGVEKTAFPSKLHSYLECYCPILCIAEKKSELSRIIEVNNIGIQVDQNQRLKLKEAILVSSKNKSFKYQYKNDIKKFKDSFFSSKNILSEWDKII